MDDKIKKKKVGTYIVLGVVVLAVVVGLFFVLRSGDGSNDFNQNPQEGMRENGMQGEMPEGFDGEMPQREGGMQMQELSEEEISSVAEFFDSNPSDDEATDYCEENMNYCMYYCMNVNQESDYCEGISPQGMGEMPQDMENFTPMDLPDNE